MKCTAYIYDDSSPLQNPVTPGHILLHMTTTRGVSLVSKNNKKLGPKEYGAVLNPSVPDEPYQLYVDDPGGAGTSPFYAPASLGDLNGSVTGNIHITLYPLPTGGGGDDWEDDDEGLASTSAEIQRHIKKRVDNHIWTPPEGLGVVSLVTTTQRSVQVPAWDAKLRAIRDRWIATCAKLGIRISGGNSGLRPARA